ncbi:AcrR family transcriptional regulator [Actinopolyspora lacussalsi]|nr:AcrR family transcriptional regulator [Actinopolyspora lacussalsi]
MAMRQERAEHTRCRVVHAAAEVVERDGVRDATLTRIVAVAGVSKGALYFHFDTKEQLADAVYEAGIARLGKVVAENYRWYHSALDTLALLCGVLVRTLRRDVVARAMIRLARETDVSSRLSGDPYHHWWLVVYRLLVRARNQREVPSGMDLEAGAGLLVSATVGLEILARNNPAWWNEGSVDRIWHMLLHVREQAVAVTGSSEEVLSEWRLGSEAHSGSALKSTARLD